MCRAILQKLGKLDISRKVTEYTDTKDPLMKALGYEGIWNPANEIKAKVDGTPTKVTEKRLKNFGIADQRAQDAVPNPGGAHVANIAARKARGPR